MQHFVVPPEAIEGDRIAFSPAQGRQITRVLRLRDGDEVVVLDGRGRQCRVRLAIGGQAVTGVNLGPASACHEPGRHVTLLVAPPRGERWEWLLQKGTELGVARFVPVVARYSGPGTAVVRERHRTIVREAVEQCRRLLVPSIDEPRPLSDALAAADTTAATVLLWERAEQPTLATVLHPLQRTEAGCAITLVVGPEGGFHQDEVMLAREMGVTVAGLGPLVLRTETAALAAAALALLG